jgi:hypothetical protein
MPPVAFCLLDPQAVGICRQLRDRHSPALAYLGDAYRAAGRSLGARDARQDAPVIFDDPDQPDGGNVRKLAEEAVRSGRQADLPARPRTAPRTGLDVPSGP